MTSTTTLPPEETSGAFPADTRGMFLRVFPSIMLPIFLAIADQTIVATALPAIAASLGDVEHISWIIVSYLIASTIAAPLYGYLGDRFGRRRLMFIALGIYMLGAVLNSLAPSVMILALTRFIQGLGGGGLMSMSQALIGEVVPPRQRGKYQGYLAAISVSATAIGPLLGAYLTLTFGWRSVFFMNIPAALIAVVLTMRLQARPGNKGEWNFDFLGLVLFACVVIPTLLALQNARTFEVSAVPLIVGLLVFAAVALFFLLRQEKSTPSPLLPIDLMRQRGVWMTQLIGVAHGATLTAFIAFMPLYLHIMGIAPLQKVGWILLISTGSIAATSMLTGRFITRTGLTMIAPSVGLIITSLSMINFAFNSAHMTFMEVAVAVGIAAIGMGTVMSVVQVTIQTLAGRRKLGAASGSIQLARTVGAALGTTLFATVLFASLSMTDPDAARMFAGILDHGPTALQELASERREIVMGEIAAAFRNAYLLLAVVSGCGAVLAWFNPSRRV
ncbi:MULTISPECIES: MFS transporter [unclassified Beijerinckia]|uniref:MFS transporter n=1 Tax=unclassified Beijerinckia TaxID=2638183 RepID=UPI0008954B61|nr:MULTISPECIES: MFS transporter [unclassified Beijerinckia]MDH7797048.1 EmrB/QacA subfamily drug resistance transporter [Beijerinckia sp. GAS462]SEC70103.1 drug resistance transporter, EmrB/QacA subfamily [Beijerinckia sp. 28-YEA-48]